jgi:YVTN family beta-propeller protein
VEDGPVGVAFNPAGTRAYVANNFSDTITVIDPAASHGVLDTILAEPGPFGLAITPDGNQLWVTNCCADTVSVIDIQADANVFIDSLDMGLFSGPEGISIDPLGRFAYVAKVGANEVAIIDVATRTETFPPVAMFTLNSTFGSFISASPPAPPTAAAATAGNTQATVTFTPPTLNGGQPVTGYTVTSNPPGGVDSNAGSTSTSHLVTGLTNGTAYTFTVTATNSIGTGAASAASNSVTPLGTPGAPTGVTATAGNAQATVTFTPPVSDGGSAITGYTVLSNPAGGVDSNAGTTGTSHVVTGLTNGVAYTFTVTAANAQGTGPASTASNSVTPATVPGAPTGATAAAGNTQATVTFTAPASNGGSAITGYTVTSNPAGGVDINAGTTGTSHVVTGLINGTAYTFTVTATNAAGTSAPSAASNSVTPSNKAFSGPTATGSGTATVSFTGGGAACAFAPPGNGPLESAFFIAVSGHPKSPPAGSAPAGVAFVHGLLDFVLVGCTPGSTVSFTVTYPSALDPGTLYYKYGPTPGNAAPQWYVLPAAITGNTATFSITDGALGDDDLTANGTVVDQGGPGGPPSEPRQVPTLSQWALLLMALLLMFTGMVASRRRIGK